MTRVDALLREFAAHAKASTSAHHDAVLKIVRPPGYVPNAFKVHRRAHHLPSLEEEDAHHHAPTPPPMPRIVPRGYHHEADGGDSNNECPRTYRKWLKYLIRDAFNAEAMHHAAGVIQRFYFVHVVGKKRRLSTSVVVQVAHPPRRPPGSGLGIGRGGH
eukprot:PhM_4_TR15691/c1_g1_i1/m.54455